MRHLLTTITGVIVFAALFMTVDWRDFNLSLSMPSSVSETKYDVVEKEIYEFDDKLWISKVMETARHSFGYEGDISMWGGWYFDSIFVGDDRMLRYDSVGPTSLSLNLIANELTVDLEDPMASEKIKDFFRPIKGFKRFHQDYKEVLDTIEDAEYPYTCTGYYTFTADYADSCVQGAGKINKFLCNLTGISKSETAKVPGLSALYAGFNPNKYYIPVYTGNVDNMNSLSDFLANKTFENWKRGGDTGETSNAGSLAIMLRVFNSQFTTYSIYEYERIGIGHGMYTECFATLDLDSGMELSTSDIFKTNEIGQVKKLLFKTMFNDKHYREWNQGLKSPEEIEARIEGWQSPDPIFGNTELDEPKRESTFELPECALLESGVVFSFQPYEIGCWAEGAYHFIVQYSELRPYLTSHAKRLIDGVTI